ncbi:MAG: NYN domain-containing protein [Lachnospiraceae bacterium]|nr:NYN domain-containing protein [Lachnospiraceae bacterium]
MEEKRFALLIDSDNVSAEYVQKILDELTKYGIVTIKRIYGDWTRSNSNKWKTVLLSNSIQPMQQFAYTNGKNATDSFMIIDAMDILYSNNVEGFCLVTSDSDFTRLAGRLREAGKHVIGMGETKTPDAFVSACDRFIYLNNISGKEQDDKEKKHARSMKSIEKAIVEILDENEDAGKPMTNIGEVGSRLLKKYPDFDVRNYGYTKFSTFCEGLKTVKIHRNNNIISLINASRQDADLEGLMKKIIVGKGGSIELSLLSQELKQQIPGFSVKNYGFSQFKKFVKSFPTLTLETDKENNVNYVRLSGK